jgi:pyrrolysine biosynthesis protein PylC
MDVEAIDDGGTMKVLEIDARLPSQTPTALYHSSGLNILTLLYGLFVNRRVERPPGFTRPRGVVYEHIRVTPGRIRTLGERIIARAGPLTHQQDFFGADEALTDYQPGRFPWVATLIITAADRLQAWNKRCRVIENIAAG